MPEPRKHHYVPQFYLRGFSEDGDSIYQIVKVKQREAQSSLYRTAIRDTAAVRDYHRLDYEEADDPNAIERELANLEGQLANGLDAALERGTENPEVRQLLTLLVSSLLMRVPRRKSHIEQLLRESVRGTGLMMERRGEFPQAPEGLKEALSFSNLRINISNWICIAYMFQVACDPQLLGLLGAMHHSIWRTVGDDELLTSDNPISLFRPDAKRGDDYGTGLGDRRVEISVPLSRHALLLLTWNQDGPKEGMLSDALTREYNRRTIVSADNVVFASTNRTELIGMVDEFRHCSASLQMETADCGDALIHLMTQWPVMPAAEYAPVR